jgi:hypothetical protein
MIIVLRPAFPFMDYLVNYDYISEVLCINKDNIELECNGKCHLKKEISKSLDNDDEGKTSSTIAYEILLSHFIPSQSIIVEFKELVRTFGIPNFLYTREYSFSFLNTIFHPPQL